MRTEAQAELVPLLNELVDGLTNHADAMASMLSKMAKHIWTTADTETSKRARQLADEAVVLVNAYDEFIAEA